MEAATIEAPSSTTPMAEQLLSSRPQPAHNATSDMAAAFEKAFPNGVPVVGEERAPGDPAKEPEKEIVIDDKPIIPEQALKPVKKEAAAITPEIEKEIAEETKGMSEKAVTKWKKIHERATAAENLLKQKEAEWAKKALPPAATDEYQELQSKYEALDEVLKKTALERHPGFKATYDGEIEKQTKLVKAIAGDKHFKSVMKVIDGGDADAWGELGDELGQFKAQQLATIATKIQQVRLEKEEQLADWKNNYAKLEKVESAQTAKTKEAHHRELINAVRKATDDLQKNDPIFRKVEGNDEWNAEIDGRLKQIQEWATSDLSPADVANLASRAVGAEKYRALFFAVFERANQLQALIGKYKGSQPNIGGSAEPANQGSIPSDMGYIEATTRRLTDMGELRTS